MLPNEQRVLDIIRSYISAHGYAPTMAEIARLAGYRARSQVHGYVNSLIEQGHLIREPRARRGLRLADSSSTGRGEGEGQLCIPLQGRIAAGQPIEALPGGEELDLQQLFLNDGRYLLRVSGDSMVDIGLFDGDIAVIEHRETAQNGEIVVALVDEQEATVKRFQRLSAEQVELRPENRTMQPMVYATSRVRIQGVLVCSLRMYNH